MSPTVLAEGFGEWLRRARSNKGMNVGQFARAAGLSTNTIRDLELGHRREKATAIQTFVTLADALEMDLGYVLLKAGYDLGADGMKLIRLQNAEAAVEAFARAERDLRVGLARAIDLFDNRRDLSAEDCARLLGELARALASTDLLSERLRSSGFPTSAFRSDVFVSTGDRHEQRPWTDDEVRFLREHSQLSHAEAAERLGRSEQSVRKRRGRLTPDQRSGDDTLAEPGGLDG